MRLKLHLFSIIFRFLWKFAGWLLLGFVAIVLFFYLTAPIYDLPEPAPFSGQKMFNPYEGIDSNNWRRGNFQIQSYAWYGLTGGSKNTNQAIDSIYTMLGYDVITTSDYMKINSYGSNSPRYIPVYEHGYGVRKFHQVLIGARKVSWRDYFLFQTVHHKQHIIKILRKYNKLIYIAHPQLRNAYSLEDMRCLTGYDGIEVLNYMRFSIGHWDAALSAGKYVTILGNDDAHDIERTFEVGYRCTYIYSRSLAGDSIIGALRNGRAFGADIDRDLRETYEEKAEKVKSIAKLTKVQIRNDTLFIGVDKPALEFRFIGQLGKILKRSGHADNAFYVIRPEDPYVRTEITFSDKNIFYLNPVARYDHEIPGNPDMASVNLVKSIIFWIISWSVVLLLVLLYLRRRFRKKK